MTETSGEMPEPAMAFLSNGKLHVRKDGVTRAVESEFERSVRERAASIERRNSWKRQGTGAMFTGQALAGQAHSPTHVPVLLTGVTAGIDGALLYSMETDAVSGVFFLDREGVETRLFHTADFRIRHAALHPGGATFAATVFHKDNARSNIAILAVHGTDFSEVTEGDSLDQMPCWVPGSNRRILFQSAGIGRDAMGRFAGLGPCTIQQVDVDSGDLVEIAAENGRDLLQPLQTEDGALYYIRKPYESRAASATLATSLKDAALFPFRLGRAILQYFNVFSMMYTGKPLVSSRGAVQRWIDPRQAFIYGNLANAAMMRAPAGDAGGNALAPASWELVRRGRDSGSEVVARHVLAFDVAADNSILYSNGAAVMRIDSDGHRDCLFRGEMISKVVAL